MTLSELEIVIAEQAYYNGQEHLVRIDRRINDLRNEYAQTVESLNLLKYKIDVLRGNNSEKSKHFVA